MLIDCSYFSRGSRHIENATLGTVPNANAEEANESIESYIAELQEPFLIKILGNKLGSRMNEYIEKNPDYAMLRRVEDRMSRTIGKSEYVRSAEKDTEANPDFDLVLSKLCEPFADYVFYHILRDMNTQATTTGLVRLKCANEYVAPIRRQVTTWNSMVDKNRLFAEWILTTECKISDIIISNDMVTKINTFNL